MIKEVNTKEYDSLEKSGSIMVEFYSKKCGPCKMLSFVLRDIDKQFPDFRIFTIDFDENQNLKERLEVTGFPTMLFIKDGREIGRLKGLQQKPAIIRMIEELI